MVSYCNANDTFCDSGNSIQVHLSYVQNNGTAALDFIVAQARSNAGGSSGGNGGGNPTVKSSAASWTAMGRTTMAIIAIVGVMGVW